MTPHIDATITNIKLNGLTENGGGGGALGVDGGSQSIWAISPGVEIGGQVEYSNVAALCPYARVSVTWRDGENVGLGASFAAAPASNGAFAIYTTIDDVLADVSAGFDIINNGGA